MAFNCFKWKGRPSWRIQPNFLQISGELEVYKDFTTSHAHVAVETFTRSEQIDWVN